MREPAVDLSLVEPLGLAEPFQPACLPVDARELRERLDPFVGEALSGDQIDDERRRPGATGRPGAPCLSI